MKAKKINRIAAFILIAISIFAFTACNDTSAMAVDGSYETEDSTISSDDNITPAPDEASEFQEAPPGGYPPGNAPGNSSSTVDHGSYAAITSENSDGTTYESTGDSENAVRVDGTTVTLDNSTINKLSGETGSGDSSNFYGVNAGLLAINGADVTLNNAIVNTSAEGGNGIFSYGEETKVTVNNAIVKTTEDSSGGVMVTGGGTMYVNNSSIETMGDHAAALRTDRGGGILVVDGGNYTSNGTGSPAIYSTADIDVKNAVLTANNSEALVIEGDNSISLTDCEVSGNMTSSNSESLHNVMIYQSMSGDADEGISDFTMTGGSLSANSGDMIYVTNTSCTINLSNVSLDLYNGVLLNIAGNSSNNWGTPGSNGGRCMLIASNQNLVGNILVDEISSLELKITDGSAFSGTINSENAGGLVSVYIDSLSKWSLSDDSYVTEITGSIENIDLGDHKLYVDGKLFSK